MRLRVKDRPLVSAALVPALVLAGAAARAQDEAAAPRKGVPGRPPVASAVIDMRAELPPEYRVSPEAPQAIHPPVGPPEGPRAVPTLGALLAAPEREVFGAPLGPSPPLTANFAALPDDLTLIPPDTYGAVGPSHLLVTLNSQVRVSDRSGAPLVADRTLNGFWGAIGGGGGAFDPRSVYDPYADRWIVLSCDDARSAGSAILLAVSQSGDPAASWNAYRFDVDPGDALWADYPNLGFNGKWVVVQFNLFWRSDDTFAHSEIYAFDRAQLYAGTTSFRQISDPTGFTQVPALTYDVAQSDIYLLESWNPGLGALRLLRITGAIGSETLSEVGFPIAGSWNQAPPVADHAPQLGSTQRIATNDDRIQDLVFRNGKLWASHTVFFSSPGPVGRASIKWWQLDPATAGVLQNGLVDDASGTNFYAYPSLAVNRRDDVLLGFSCFAATRFASACYAFRSASDAPGTLQDVATLKEGEAKYYKIYSGTVNRWGDYSATLVDPVNDADFWTLQEYAMLPAGIDRWGTWWGELARPPDITINDVSLAEGNSGTTNARFTISLSFPSTRTVTVGWAAADGTATLADNDYLAAGGTVSFPPGSTTQSVDVPVVGDLKLEPNETFVVNLSNPVFGVIADAQGQGTILNDDATPQMSIDDVRVVEGNTGTTGAAFTVTLTNPSASPIQASWGTSDATAVAPGDYAANSGTVSFAPGDTAQTLVVLVNGDTLVESNETWNVDLSSPVGAVLAKTRGVGTILDDDGATNPDVTAFTIVSGGTGAADSGVNRLQWVNPVGGSPIEMRIRYNLGNSCTPPNPTAPGGPSDGLISFAPVGAPGEPRFQDHSGLALNTSVCYTFWVIHSGSVPSAGVSGIGRPFDATRNLKWKYETGTGTTGVAAPTVALDGVFAVDNSGAVHAMARSAGGGAWPGGPPGWNPLELGAASQMRNPVVPLRSGSRLYVLTQDGRVHAVDTGSGAPDWTTALSPTVATGAPAGVFTAFGGEHDAIFAGTSAADNNVLYALDPATGAPIATFNSPGIGPIFGMPLVDYSRAPQNRVYFASWRGTAPETLWCLNLGPPGPTAFTIRWKWDLGNISGSPVLRNGRIYVGTDNGEVKSVRADDGQDVRTIALGDGPVKGLVFPDRASDDVYVSTNGRVWRLTDTAGGWVNPWAAGVGSVALPNPSVPLLWPGTTHLYVGGGDGRLYQIETPGGALTWLDLDYAPAAFVVGAPSFDLGYNLVLVGSVRGVFYAVQAPLP